MPSKFGISGAAGVHRTEYVLVAPSCAQDKRKFCPGVEQKFPAGDFRTLADPDLQGTLQLDRTGLERQAVHIKVPSPFAP